MAPNKTVDYTKALLMGFIATPVFFVVLNVISYEMHHFVFYRGEPISIHEIAIWLLMLTPRAHNPDALSIIILSWVGGWLLAWSRSRSLVSLIVALATAYILYVLYLIVFWRMHIIIEIPDDLIPIFLVIVVVTIASIIRNIRPRKTIFDKLEKVGIVFPDSWKKPIELPLKCPNCGAPVLSSSEYCWNCGKKLEVELHEHGD